MSWILLRAPIKKEQLQQLQVEFPAGKFRNEDELSSPEDWSKVEILFGNKLTEPEFSQATHLRWIHSPSPYMSDIALGEGVRSQDILTTNTKGENLTQTGEFAIAALLAFSKGLLQWSRVPEQKHSPWNHQPTFAPWAIEGKTLLQIGLGMVGTEITRRAAELGMRIWGMRRHPSFHPHCDRVYPLHDLPTLLRAADIISISLPRGKRYKPWLGSSELKAIKKESILLIVGAGGTVDLDALATLAEQAPYRGVLIDSSSDDEIGRYSSLLNSPNVLITPNIAPLPRHEEQLAFQTFRYNLRQFTHGNYLDMKNRIHLQDDEN